jgi:hypothetical protein
MGDKRGPYQPPAKSHVLSAHEAGAAHASECHPFDPPIWIRADALYLMAYTRGFNAATAARRINVPVGLA